MYDKAAADLIEALDAASAYRAQATEHALEAEAQRTVAEYRLRVNERRNGVERRQHIEALDVASAYRATASTLHQEIERRNGVERRSKIFDPENPALSRHDATYREGGDRRKSWPR
jgi:hypothetical protein